MTRNHLLIVFSIAAVSALCLASLLLSNDGQTSSAESRLPALSDDSAEVTASLPLFHRVSDLYTRGAQPNHGGVIVLSRLGVKTIVDLRSEYDHTDDASRAAARLGLAYHWMPMSVWEPPTDIQTAEFLKLVTDSSKGPFFVFCADGVNRTGEMTAIYRVAHDHWNVEQALKEADDAGFGPYYWNLRQYVWTYARKFQPVAVPKEGRALSMTEKD